VSKVIPWEKSLRREALAARGRSLPDQRSVVRLVNRILKWYAHSGRTFYWRRSSLRTYEVVIIECLLQRTRAETVEQFLPEFLTKYPDWDALVSEPQDSLERSLKPIGLQQRRAATLRRLAQAVVAAGRRVPGDAVKLCALPGVGQYMFYAINLYRRDEALPLLDSGMARLLERYFGQKRLLVDLRYDPYLQQLARKVVQAGSHKAINWAILDVAAKYCRPRKPVCLDCPIAKGCHFAYLAK